MGSGEAGSAADYGSALARSALRSGGNGGSGSYGGAVYEGSAVYGGYGSGGMGGGGGIEGAAPLGAGAPLFEGSTILEREAVGKYAVSKGAPVRDCRTLTPVRNQVAEGDLKNILMGETNFSGEMTFEP